MNKHFMVKSTIFKLEMVKLTMNKFNMAKVTNE
jgi:hypothetical protein